MKLLRIQETVPEAVTLEKCSENCKNLHFEKLEYTLFETLEIFNFFLELLDFLHKCWRVFIPVGLLIFS